MLGIALLWSIGLVIAAILAPFYQSQTSSISSTSGAQLSAPSVQVYTHASATLVQVNGLWVLWLVSAPLVAVVVVALVLRFRAREARPGAGVLAWTVTVLLGAFAVVGILSIGRFILPVAVLVVLACAMTPKEPAPSESGAPPGGI